MLLTIPPPDLIEKFVEGLKGVILNHPLTRKEDFYVHLNALEASSLNILFRTHLEVGSYAEELKAKEDLLLGILRLAETLKIDFAFPSSTVYVGTGASEDALDSASADEKLNKFIEDFKSKNSIKD